MGAASKLTDVLGVVAATPLAARCLALPGTYAPAELPAVPLRLNELWAVIKHGSHLADSWHKFFRKVPEHLLLDLLGEQGLGLTRQHDSYLLLWCRLDRTSQQGFAQAS